MQCLKSYCWIWRKNNWQSEVHDHKGKLYLYPVAHAQEYEELMNAMEGVSIKWVIHKKLKMVSIVFSITDY